MWLSFTSASRHDNKAGWRRRSGGGGVTLRPVFHCVHHVRPNVSRRLTQRPKWSWKNTKGLSSNRSPLEFFQGKLLYVETSKRRSGAHMGFPKREG